jgi:hypothetical protein
MLVTMTGLIRYCLFKTSLWVRHNKSRQPYGKKKPCIQRDFRYADFGSHCMLEIESSNFLADHSDRAV